MKLINETRSYKQGEQMSKDLKVKESAELEITADMLEDLPSADASDYRIPNLCVVQPTSKLQANPGEIVDLNTKQVMSTASQSLNFVPLWFWKSWEIFHVDKQNNREYRGKELFSPANALWKWEEEVATGIIKRHLNTNVFMILEKDLESPMPQLYMFKFRGKSSNEGKKLLTFWTNAKNYKQIPYSYVFSITPSMVTDQKGKYFVATIANVMNADKYRQISGKALKVAHGWVGMIKTNLSAMTSANLTAEDPEIETDNAPMPTQPMAPDTTQNLSF